MSFPVRDLKMQKVSGKILKLQGFKGLKLETFKPHGLCIFLNIPRTLKLTLACIGDLKVTMNNVQ